MTLDASALVAIVLKEPGYEEVVARLADDENPRVPATALAEAGMVMRARTGASVALKLQILINKLHLTVVPFTESNWNDALSAYEDGLEADPLSRPRLGACLSESVATKLGSQLLSVRGRI
jgi:ribonuclease VapC